jgi:hypothetical protein
MPIRISRPLMLIILLLALAGVLALMVIYPIYGADFYYVFYPAARASWDKQILLYGANESAGFFYPPHTMYYWLLLSLAPMPLANAVHALVTVGLMLATSHVWREFTKWNFLAVALAIANIHTVDQLIRGQVDMLAVFGLVLAFAGATKRSPHLLGLGATMALIKPTNAFLPLFLIAWSLRHWNWREIAKAAIIPSVTLLSTLLIFGFDWPYRLFATLRHGLPYNELTSLTIWKLAEAAQLPVIVPAIISIALLLGLLKYHELSPQNYALIIATNFLITFYAAGYHYVALIPALMCIRSRKWLVFCWLLSFLPLLRLLSFNFSWLSLLYPIAICTALLWQAAHDEKSREAETNPVLGIEAA